ncbi:MAG TPA: hypothetical protein VHL34_24810 [Rhizomicrobium sp.]|jgi:hypothetical protein|nr:hypothetical protein [Rhizomicrobium sp.]
MNSPITSVTENRVTVTANDTEENIRAAAGFAEPDTKAEEAAEPEAPTAPAGERNPDGTFKAKAAEPKPADEPAKLDGDPRKSHQAKINQAIAKQRDAERRAEEAERRAAEREAELQALRQPTPASVPAAHTSTAPTYLQLVQRYQSDPEAPKFDDFVAAGVDDAYGAHQAALAAFIADKRLEEREARDAARRAETERASHAQAAKELLEQKHPGFLEHLAADTTIYPRAVLDLIAAEAQNDPDLSAELLHHLLTHPDDAAQLARQATPIAAAREIGRLTARLSSASSGPETVLTHTTAKPLIKPVRPSVMAPESSPPDDLPFGPKYIAAMNERDRKAREARRA